MKKTDSRENFPAGEGILLVNKEAGITAFYLIKILRKKSGIQKIGHAGTLDPFATGVMVLLVGRPYTKIADQFIQNDKEYSATIQLGIATNTYDSEGSIISQSTHIPSLDEIKKCIEEFQGEQKQTPPMFSAKKVNGEKLYDLARRGIEIPREPVSVNINIELIDYTYPHLKIHVRSSKGTYIRSLAHDMGEKLGCYGYLTELIRTRSGNFHLKDCIDTKSLFDPSFSYIPYLKKTII